MTNMAANAEVVQDLELRTHKRIRLFPEGTFTGSAGDYVERVGCSSKYGITLTVLPQNRIHSFKTADLHHLEKINETDPEITDLKSRVIDYFQENVHIKFVGLSCNGRVVAFAVDTSNGPFVHIFDLLAFAPDVNTQPFPLATIKASRGNDKFSCIEWNPEVEDILAVGTSDGSVSTFKYSLATPNTYSLLGTAPLPFPPTCMSWSRKGKQLMVGDASGRLHQLKPELQSVRVVPAPEQLPGIGLPVSCAGLFWVSTTDWLVAYRENADPTKLTLSFLTVKKNQPPSWTFYGDVTFQRPNAPPYDTGLHFVPLMEWNMVFIYAHRSPDVVVLGQRNGVWINFVMERFNITMPLTQQKGDSQPIGCALDFTLQSNVVLERTNPEAPVLSPQPMIYVLSSTGLLLSYHVCSLDSNRPLPIVKPIGYSPQEVANGTAPAGYTPRQTTSTPQQPAAIQPTPAFSPLSTATSKLPTQNPSAIQMPTIIQTPAVASAQPTTQTLQSAVAPPVVAQPDPIQQLETEMEQSINAYCQIQSSVTANLERLGLVRTLIEEKVEGFDSTCVDELWELLQRVQQSLDDGVHSSETVGRQIAGLTSRVRQCGTFYGRYRDKKRLLPSSSNLLEELRSAEKRFVLLEAEIRKFNSAFESFEKENKASAQSRSTSQSPPSGLEPISTEDQNQINLVNGEISRRVARYARKVAFIQQRVQLIKAYADRQSLYVEETSDTNENKIEDTKEKKAEDTNRMTEDLHRFLLIVDSQDANESVQRDTSRSSDTMVKKQPVNERQLALKRLMEQHAQSPRAVRTVCPKKLVVDETLNASEKTPRRQRTTAAEDAGISRQLMAAKNSPILSNRLASVATPPRLSGSLTLGTPISPVAMISAAKSATGPTAQVQQKPTAAPVTSQQTFGGLSQKPGLFSSTTPATGLPSISTTQPTSQAPAILQIQSQSITTTTVETITPTVTTVSAKPTEVTTSLQQANPVTTTAPTSQTSSGFSFAPKTTTAAPTVSSTSTAVVSTAPTSFSFAPQTTTVVSTASSNTQSQPISFSFAPNNSTSQPATAGFFIGASQTANSTAPKPATFTFMPQTQTNVPTTTAAASSVPFSFAPKPATQQSSVFGNAFGTNTATASAATDDGMEDDTNSGATSSFSFASTGLGSTTAANRTGGGFGSLNWGAMSQRPAAPSPFGSFGSGAAAQPTQPTQTGSAFGNAAASGSAFGSAATSGSAFGSAAAFGSGPSFGSGNAFGGNSAFGSTAFKSPFGNASSTAQASPSSGGFSAFANKAASFGQLAQQSPNGSNSLFGQQQQQTSFGNTSFASPSGFGTSPAFATPNTSPAYTTFRK
ncbi:hypothetical protein M3Y94_00475700 [Aphelenchoides besseyi]|nr:hypothetical protein M3Y94_00475700 [Aphelenchoides besseyi]KAI6219929.1 hypothetical protein M3Y95_01079500 [Aphelenchoides besseyi]